jgi:hypothetical protein
MKGLRKTGNATWIAAAILLSGFVYSGVGLAAEGKHPNHVIGLFAGMTDTKSEREFTYGIEYEFRFSKMFGAGLIYETSPDLAHGAGVDVGFVALHLHPIGDLRVTAGIGQEKSHGHKQDAYRLGLAYDFPIGSHYAVAPTANVDFVEVENAVTHKKSTEKVYVYGVVLSMHF